MIQVFKSCSHGYERTPHSIFLLIIKLVVRALSNRRSFLAFVIIIIRFLQFYQVKGVQYP